MSRLLRYTLILVLVALGTGLAALSGWRYARASAPVNGPIILVSIDALRADRLAVYGYQDGQTPAIDALAKDGIVFERAFSHVPQTLPAHASLLTGRLPFEHGVRDGVGFTVSANERLLAEMLADRGYATAGVASSYLLRKATGIGQGFTVFDAVEADETRRAAPLVRDGLESERIVEHWFDSASTTRAFLFLHLAEPAIDVAVAAGAPLTYDARVSKADDIIGRLVRYLKAHQLYDQSTILLTADHGQGLGTLGETGHGVVLHDDLLRVPLIVKPAAGGNTGRRVTTPVQHIDIVPTILDLAKAPIPGNLRGRSLAPLFNGGRFENRTFYAESLFGRYHFGWEPLTSVSDGRYRLVSGTPARLFDIDAAEREQDVAGRHPEIVAKLQRSLADLSPATAPAPMGPVSPVDRARLERFGYVGSPAPAGNSDTAASQNDASIVEQYRSAVAMVAADRMTDAIDAFTVLTSELPASADAWSHLAAVAARAEKHDLSASAYRHVAELTPASADGYFALANALLRLRRFEDARIQVQKILDGGIGGPPAAATAHELLARAALGRRNYDVARAEAEKAEATEPGRPVLAYVSGRIAVDQRRYADALAEFESALASLDSKRLPPLADLRLYTAEALVRAQRLSEAEYLFLEQLKDTPSNPRAIAGLTTIYRTTGRTDEISALSH